MPRAPIRFRMPAVLAATLLATLALPSAPGTARAWSHDPSVNNPVCTAVGSQTSPVSLPDGSGGMFVAWVDSRAGGDDIYATHILKGGSPAPGWPANGVAICTATSTQYGQALATDGAGGFFVTWQDARSVTSWDIYAQHITSAGTVAAGWPVNGLGVATTTQDEQVPEICSDGASGAFIVWTYTFTPSTDYDIYGTHVLANGTLATGWPAGGKGLVTPAGIQNSPSICPDGLGGAFVAYEDNLGGNYDVKLLQVSASATVTGPVNADWGSGDQLLPLIIPDGSGGTYLLDQSFNDYANVARFTPSMALASGWFAEAVGYNSSTLACYPLGLLADGQGGVYASWGQSAGLDEVAYVQHILPNAQIAPGWPYLGTPLSNSSVGSDGAATVMVSDGAGGVITSYPTASGVLMAMRLYANGSVASGWNGAGNALSIAAGGQYEPTLAPDGSGGAVVAWMDYRNGGSNADIFADRIDHYGQLGDPEPVVTGVGDVLGDQGGHVRVSWLPSYLDTEPTYGINDYILYRQAPAAGLPAALRRAGATLLTPEQADADARAARVEGTAVVAAPPGRFLARPDGMETTYWEQLAYVNAAALPAYGIVAATTCDSIAGSNPRTLFMVEAVGTFTGPWFSAPDSGYSVDNLAPVAPAPFTGNYVAGTGTILTWGPNGEADLAGYRLYKGTSAAFVPSLGNRVAQVPGNTSYVDPSPLPAWYKLSAYDIHGNESGFATLLPAGTTGVGDAVPHELAFTLGSANPVRGALALRLALPSAASVRVTVFDATGREVRTLATGTFPAGVSTLAWDGAAGDGAPAPSGLYFARLETAGHAIARRIVVAR